MDKFLTHLAERRGKLQKQLHKLQVEIADLDKAERLYRDSGAVAPTPVLAVPLPPPPPTTVDWTTLPQTWPPPPPQPSIIATQHGFGKTIKERVLQLLERNPAGLTSSQILNNLNIDGGQNLSRESLSPQLSRLRIIDKRIDLKDGVWSLQKHENPAWQGGVFK